jgi:excinuclease ABC subunit C
MNMNFKNLPESTGVYIMKGTRGKILYIGKAINIKRRIASHFSRPHGNQIERMRGEVKKIDYKETDSALEALILEAQLIKKYQPPYNIKEKDDKSFLFVEITKEKFPRVLLVRGTSRGAGTRFGPFISAKSIRHALKIIRRIFPWSLHTGEALRKKETRGCFDYQIGLCPGTCMGKVTRDEYRKNIRKIKLFFQGKKARIVKELEKEMRTASKETEFEKAGKIKRQIFALRHIQDTALISARDESETRLNEHEMKRIEGYDISNISGTSAVGSMVVFVGGKPDKNEYRKFKIRTIQTPDDTGMLREVIQRRLKHPEWALPDLMLIDGGKGQVNAAKRAVEEHGFKIPIIGIAKGAKRKKNEFIGKIPEGTSERMLIKIRNEAHRFAITYHRKLRAKL